MMFEKGLNTNIIECPVYNAMGFEVRQFMCASCNIRFEETALCPFRQKQKQKQKKRGEVMKIVCANRKECPEGKWCRDGAKRGCSKFVPKTKIDWDKIMSGKKKEVSNG